MADPNAERRAEVAKYFLDENLEGEPKVVVSPSGRFRLTIQTYRTAPGRWNYSRGTVTRIADGATVCDIQRNYEMFHHSFVIKDGREYLITGRSYMSQTIVDLDPRSGIRTRRRLLQRRRVLLGTVLPEP